MARASSFQKECMGQVCGNQVGVLQKIDAADNVNFVVALGTVVGEDVISNAKN